MNTTINLVTEIYSKNAEGMTRTTTSSKTVFADVESISSVEFFRAGEQGLKPQYRMTVYCSEYNGEKIVEYKGNLFSVYRTFQSHPDRIELYVQNKVGVNNG